MASLATVGHREVPYTEKAYMGVLETPLVSSGILSFSAPARLEKHVMRPDDETYVADGENLRLRNPAKGIDESIDLHDNPLAWAFVESFRATFTGNTDALRRFYAVKLDGDRERWFLTLTPLEPEMAKMVTAIRIEGSADRISTVTVNEAGGDHSVLTIGEAGQ